MLFVEVVGWISVFLLCMSGVPQLVKMIKTKSVNDVSLTMILCWFFGCLGMFIYSVVKAPTYQLVFNYSYSTIINFLILFYYLKYKK